VTGTVRNFFPKILPFTLIYSLKASKIDAIQGRKQHKFTEITFFLNILRINNFCFPIIAFNVVTVFNISAVHREIVPLQDRLMEYILIFPPGTDVQDIYPYVQDIYLYVQDIYPYVQDIYLYVQDIYAYVQCIYICTYSMQI
jgi:hypothetical protein